MARQYIIGGFIGPLINNETASRQYILSDVFVNDTTTSGGSTGTLILTQGAQTLSATGTNLTHGSLVKTQGAQTVSATGTVLDHGSLVKNQGAQTLSASGTNLDHGVLNLTQGVNTLSATGHNSAAIHGALAITQGANAIIARGLNANPVVSSGGAADEPYADVARRKYLEWIRTRRSRSARRLSALPVAPVVVPGTTVPTPEQKQDGLLLRNLHQVRAFAAPVTSVPLASRAPDAREAIAKVVAALRQNAEQDDEEAIAFLLENDL